MDSLNHILDLLICVNCKSGRLQVVHGGLTFVCKECSSKFGIVNNVPCFVPDDLADFSEVTPLKRESFIEAKSMTYFENSFVSSMYRHYHEYAAARRLQVGPCPKTLDVGFGVGEHYPFITEAEKAAGNFVGVDLDRFKLEYFSELHPHVPVLQASAFNLPLADNCMEVVQLLATLEHFTLHEIDMILNEALRTLKPGGVLITCYPAEGGFLLRIGQVLMHALIRQRSGFDLENEKVHRHLSTASDIRKALEKRADLERTETCYYPFNLPCINLSLFVNEQYRKVPDA